MESNNKFAFNKRFLFSITVLTLINLSQISSAYGQYGYETPNNICGGWFKSGNGSIKFNYTLSLGESLPTLEDQVCVWTISPVSYQQNTAHTINIQQTSGLICDPRSSVGISFFDDRSKVVSSSYNWQCGGPQVYTRVSGALMVVVFRTPSLGNGTGFTLTWTESGDWVQREGITTQYTTFGKSDVEPLPYFASSFSRNQIATYAFPKGNTTKGFRLELTFDTRLSLFKFENCTIDCAENVLLVCNILETGRLQVNQVFAGQGTNVPVPTESFVNEWGLFILVWVGDYWGAGGRFQLDYQTIR